MLSFVWNGELIQEIHNKLLLSCGNKTELCSKFVCGGGGIMQ
jgi:hypothetical protein